MVRRPAAESRSVRYWTRAFKGSEFAVTVDNASGLITDVSNDWNRDQFMRQVGDAFTEWLTTTSSSSSLGA